MAEFKGSPNTNQSKQGGDWGSPENLLSEKNKFQGSKTAENLMKAFAGESQARNRYTFFAQAAKEEGFDAIAATFEETAHNEKHHAEIFFAFLEGGDLEITAGYPAGKVGTTLENSTSHVGDAPEKP